MKSLEEHIRSLSKKAKRAVGGVALTILGAGMMAQAAFASQIRIQSADMNAGRYAAEIAIDKSCEPGNHEIVGASISESPDIEPCETLVVRDTEVVGGDVELIAGKQVEIGPGFSVATGARLSIGTSQQIRGDAHLSLPVPPAPEYSARFHVNTDNLQLNGGQFEHLNGYDTTGKLRFALGIADSTGPHLFLSALSSSGMRVSTAQQCELPLGRGWQEVNLYWGEDLSVVTRNGSLSLEDCLSQSVGAAEITSLRWGVVNLEGDVRGSLLLDDYEDESGSRAGFEACDFNGFSPSPQPSSCTIIPTPALPESVRNLTVAAKDAHLTSVSYTGCLEAIAENGSDNIVAQACPLNDDPLSGKFDVIVTSHTEGPVLDFGGVQVGDPTKDGIQNGVTYAVGEFGNAPSFISLRHANGWPKEHNTVLEVGSQIPAQMISYDFGDGSPQEISETRIFHSFPATGVYFVQADLTGSGGELRSIRAPVQIDAPDVTLDPGFPLASRITTGRLAQNRHRFTCEPVGFRPDGGVLWTVNGAPVSDELKTVVLDLPDGEYDITCRMDPPPKLGFASSVFSSRFLRAGPSVEDPDSPLRDAVRGLYVFDNDLIDRVSGYNGTSPNPVLFVPGVDGEGVLAETVSFARRPDINAAAAWAKRTQDEAYLQVGGRAFGHTANGRAFFCTRPFASEEYKCDTSFWPMVLPNEWIHFGVDDAPSHANNFYVNGEVESTGDQHWDGAQFDGLLEGSTLDNLVLLEDNENGDISLAAPALYNDGTGMIPYTKEELPDVCYSNVNDPPITTNVGEVTSDEMGSDSCRYVSASQGPESTEVRICPNSDSSGSRQWPTGFEIMTSSYNDDLSTPDIVLTFGNVEHDRRTSNFTLGEFPLCYDLSN